jgi:hypothetical protein
MGRKLLQGEQVKIRQIKGLRLLVEEMHMDSDVK